MSGPASNASPARHDPRTLPEILAALEATTEKVARFFEALPRDAFFSGDSKRWGPAHHLGHLALSNRRIADGFAARARLPVHATGRSRTYAEMKQFCVTEIERVPRASLEDNPFAAVIDRSVSQPEAVAEYEAAGARLRDAAAAWSEAECDTRAMRHPFFGPFTGREMLFFVLLHDRNHLTGVRRRLERESTP